jgi:hypothetical protein
MSLRPGLDEVKALSLQLHRRLDEQPLAMMQLYCRLADAGHSPSLLADAFSMRRSERAAAGGGGGWRGVAILSVPKSASTFLWRLLEHVSGSFEYRSILQSAAGRALLPDADLFHAVAIRTSETPTVVREHLLANANTLLFLEQSRLWPVILRRDVDDALVSLAEEWERQWSRSRPQIEHDGYHAQFLGAVPCTFIDNFLRADWSARYDMTIDLALSWYGQFLAGWAAVRSRNPQFGTFLCYDDVAKDCVASVATILRALEVEPRLDIGRAAEQVKARREHANLNVGRSGRGRELLTASQRVRIERGLTSFGPSLTAEPRQGARSSFPQEITAAVEITADRRGIMGAPVKPARSWW